MRTIIIIVTSQPMMPAVIEDLHGDTAMNALLVGADRLGNIPAVLADFGNAIGRRVSGRDPAHQKRTAGLPAGIGIVIIFTDFLGHNVMRRFREAAEREGLPVVCCRRSTCSVQAALARIFGSGCAACPGRAEGRNRR
jgi:hypothetical protein